MSRIVLHIDRLVLDGIDRCDARELAEGLESGLRRLLADPALADALAADADRVELGRQQLGAAGPRAVGNSVAGAIVRRIAR